MKYFSLSGRFPKRKEFLYEIALAFSNKEGSVYLKYSGGISFTDAKKTEHCGKAIMQGKLCG